MDPQLDKQEIVIVGAGIIGVASAACLSDAGYQVILIDRQGVCEGTSSGNAGALAFSDILPMASKGILAKVPRWLMDPLGPFTIRPSYLPRLTPWLYRFWRASRADNLERTVRAGNARVDAACRNSPHAS
jgi:D-amino-acid dehydrogenase